MDGNCFWVGAPDQWDAASIFTAPEAAPAVGGANLLVDQPSDLCALQVPATIIAELPAAAPWSVAALLACRCSELATWRIRTGASSTDLLTSSWPDEEPSSTKLLATTPGVPMLGGHLGAGCIPVDTTTGPPNEVVLPHNAAWANFGNTNHWGWEAWLNFPSFPSSINRGPIFEWFHDAGKTDARWLNITNAGQITFGGSSTGAAATSLPSPAFTEGVWHHLALDYQHFGGGVGMFSIYIDGQLAGQTGSSFDPGLVGGELRFGEKVLSANNYGGPVEQIPFLMDELRFWSTTRAQGTIDTEKDAELPWGTANLAAVWHFNTEGALTPTYDSGVIALGLPPNKPEWTHRHGVHDLGRGNTRSDAAMRIDVDDPGLGAGDVIELGRLFVFDPWRPSHNYSFGASLAGFTGAGRHRRTRGGRTFPDARTLVPVSSWALEHLSRDEAYDSWWELVRMREAHRAVLAAFDRDEGQHLQQLTRYGLMNVGGGPQRRQYARWQVAMEIEELLP